MAITAWSAKVSTNSTCRVGERLDLLPPEDDDADGDALAKHWDTEQRSIPTHLLALAVVIFRSASTSWNLNRSSLERSTPSDSASTNTHRVPFKELYETLWDIVSGGQAVYLDPLAD